MKIRSLFRKRNYSPTTVIVDVDDFIDTEIIICSGDKVLWSGYADEVYFGGHTMTISARSLDTSS